MLNKHGRISGPCSPFPLAEGSGMSQQKFNLARLRRRSLASGSTWV
ncbi:hypothetical protein ACFFW8_03320 [Erwinia tracheiphila]